MRSPNAFFNSLISPGVSCAWTDAKGSNSDKIPTAIRPGGWFE